MSGTSYYQELTGLELLKYQRDIGILFERLCQEQFEPDLLKRICECAVLGFYSLKDEKGESLYDSPEELLTGMSFRELARIPEEYESRFPEEEYSSAE